MCNKELPLAKEPFFTCKYCKTHNSFWGERLVVMRMRNIKEEVIHCYFCGKAHLLKGEQEC